MKAKFMKIIALCFALCLATAVFAACGKTAEFHLNFMVDGEVYATVDTAGNETITMPRNPQKDGYDFDGWYWDNGTWERPFTANSLLEASLSADMSVYAKWKTDETLIGKQAEIVSAPAFTFDGLNGFVSVANNTEAFSFIGQVTVSERATWQISTDIYGVNSIPTKTVPLTVGDNLFYLLVTSGDGETITLYTVNVRRRPIYTVTFDTAGGTEVTVQEVEENSFATEPTIIPTRTGYTFTEWDYDFATPIIKSQTITAQWTKNAYQRDGNVLYFGEYPQTIKSENVYITDEQDNRGYYLGSDGEYYAKITATGHYAYSISSTGTTIINGNDYYFKVEPIKWRILSESDGTALVLCENIISSSNYYRSTATRIFGETIYPNNYQYSDIRIWLNDQFYNTAFNTSQQAIIETTTVDNSAQSTNPQNDAILWVSGDNIYVCANTEDKVFLLSVQEITNSTFGFNSNYNDFDMARRKQPSDYSLAIGALAYDEDGEYDEYSGNGVWLLRSPYFSNENFVCEVNIGGTVASGWPVNSEDAGIVPALQIRF